MIYDTTRRRVALLLHETEPSSAMIADTTAKMLEKRGFRVKVRDKRIVYSRISRKTRIFIIII